MKAIQLVQSGNSVAQMCHLVGNNRKKNRLSMAADLVWREKENKNFVKNITKMLLFCVTSA
jgi:hypothetical protein